MAPSAGAALVAMTRSPVRIRRAIPPQGPTRISRVAPRRSSSSTTMARLGVPMPVAWTLTGRPCQVPVKP
ncbi:MAG: hypothetical protein A2X23_09295 [Chloroflexi bacterium GWC2_73_18]|nr:MAG: hypothetical protein A2X23_09295 [Chloroflexi bacterium GWC2_73_18]